MTYLCRLKPAESLTYSEIKNLHGGSMKWCGLPGVINPETGPTDKWMTFKCNISLNGDNKRIYFPVFPRENNYNEAPERRRYSWTDKYGTRTEYKGAAQWQGDNMHGNGLFYQHFRRWTSITQNKRKSDEWATGNIWDLGQYSNMKYNGPMMRKNLGWRKEYGNHIISEKGRLSQSLKVYRKNKDESLKDYYLVFHPRFGVEAWFIIPKDGIANPFHTDWNEKYDNMPGAPSGDIFATNPNKPWEKGDDGITQYSMGK